MTPEALLSPADGFDLATAKVYTYCTLLLEGSDMHVKEHEHCGIFVYHIEGNLSGHTISEFKKHFVTGLSAKRVRIILNFGKTDYIDSMGIAALIWLWKRVEEAKGKLAMTAISPKIESVLKITRIDRAFSIFETEKDVIKKWGGKE
jgi:anti-anti-sigma factor